jgi:general secretion pathway protein D
LKQESSHLAAAYRRRAYCTVLGAGLVAAGLTAGRVVTQAQDQKPAGDSTTVAQADKGQGKKTDGKQPKEKKGNGPSLRVVPVPRKDAQDKGTKAAAPPTATAPPGPKPGGPPITIIPGKSAVPGDTQITGAPGGKAGGTPFAFDFRGADITNVLKFYSTVSGLTIIADQALSGPVTIINPKPVTLDEAFRILQSVLGVRGFSAYQTGNVLTIAGLDVVGRNTPLLNTEPDGGPADPHNQVMTQVIPLNNVDAKALSTELQPLINKGASLIGSDGTNSLILTDTANNVQRFIKLVHALDETSSNSEMAVYPLKRAEATAIAEIINSLYGKLTTRGKGGPPQPGQPPPQPGQPAPPGGARPAVVAVADPRTNAVIVVASRENQEQIAKDIIKRLDDDDSNTMDTEIIKIQYSDAVTVGNLINTVLSNMHGSGSSGGGSNFQSRAFGGYNPYGGGGGDQSSGNVTSTDPFGKVVPDPRTNSLLVTASAERMVKIKELIRELDVPVKAETTTFVIPLKNAQAEDVTYALTQALSTQNQNSGGYPFFGFFGGRFGNTGNTGINGHQPIQRRQGSQNSGRAALPRYNNGFPPGYGNGVPPGPPNPPDDGSGAPSAMQGNGGSAQPEGIQGVMTPNGFVPTDPGGADKERTRQYYYDYYGGGQRRGLGSSNSPQYGRGSSGSYVNLLRLQNNVFVTPTPNGDGLIVTTTPDNKDAVERIIEALDVVPRQVMIEVIVAEVTLDADQKLGFNLGGMLKNILNKTNTGNGQISLPAAGFPPGTNAPDPSLSGFQFLLSGVNYQAVLQALTTDTKVKVLATPRVFTSNNQAADIEITTNVPYISGQDAGFFGGGTVQNNVLFKDIGFILHATPRITRQGLVTIDVIQDASDLLRYEVLGTGTSALRAPVFDDRYADTSVTVQDGETVVIGGLIRDRTSLITSKVPLLGDIPLIGQFFRSREKTRSKVELMIFMTPHVINSVEEAREMTRQQGAPVIRQIPDLPIQQPNLDLKQDYRDPHNLKNNPRPDSLQPGKTNPPTSNPNGNTNPNGSTRSTQQVKPN